MHNAGGPAASRLSTGLWLHGVKLTIHTADTVSPSAQWHAAGGGAGWGWPIALLDVPSAAPWGAVGGGGCRGVPVVVESPVLVVGAALGLPIALLDVPSAASWGAVGGGD